MTYEHESLGAFLKNLVFKSAAGSDEQHGESVRYGGVTVPEEVLSEALRRRGDSSPVLSRVTRIPMTRSSRIKIPARVDSNHSTSVSGGLRLYRRPETTSLTSSQMDMEQVELTGESLSGMCYVSDELLSDGPIEAVLENGFMDELDATMLREFLGGTGTGESLGVLNSPALISISTSGQTTGTLTGANIQSMAARVWHYEDAIWLANHDCFTQLAESHIALTNSDRPCLTHEGGQLFLLGRPLFLTEECSSLSTLGDIVCGVWSEYLLGVRSDAKTESSIHVRFENSESTLRFTFRGSGAPWWRSALTPVNSSDTLSPFVALATRTT